MINKIIKSIYPIICVLIPLILFFGLEGHSYALPCFVFGAMVGFSNFVYENEFSNWIGIIVPLVNAIIFLIIGPIYYSYCLFGKWVLLLPFLLLYMALFLYITICVIKSGKSFKTTIVFRKLLAIHVVVICVLFIIPGLYSIIDTQNIKSLFSFDINFIGLVSSAFWLLVIALEIYISTRKLYIFTNYYKPFYILYLRRFATDDSTIDMKCIEDLTKNEFGLELMKIGNPASIFQCSMDYSCVFLGTTNWKKQLRQYIKCAKIVFVQVDVSDGVIWEMFENTDYKSKYIYNVPQTKNIPLIISSLSDKIDPVHRPFFLRIRNFLYFLLLLSDKNRN